ncbi:MAG: hypothetical protein U1C46_10355 [Bacteroidales bacterium]|nr:hypothetical protein [Bacteroidales bacterium]MDZ4205205.1 hypothetical protein [Bacteroidales bacterium]
MGIRKFLTLIIAGLVLTLVACEYEFIEPDNTLVPEDVRFAKDIIPIFNASCNMIGCHAPGAKSPDLSAANAYNDLIQKNMINTGSPAQSKLYKSITTGSMKNFASTAQAKIILAWIEQGALNN